jgi:hypothetical protein
MDINPIQRALGEPQLSWTHPVHGWMDEFGTLYIWARVWYLVYRIYRVLLHLFQHIEEMSGAMDKLANERSLGKFLIILL